MSVMSAKITSIKPGHINAETIKRGIMLYDCIIMSVFAEHQVGSHSNTVNGPAAVVCCFTVTRHVS